MLFFRTTKILKSKKKTQAQNLKNLFSRLKNQKLSLFSLASEREQVLLNSFFFLFPRVCRSRGEVAPYRRVVICFPAG